MRCCGSIFGRPTPCKLNGGGSCGFGAGILGGNCNCADGYFGQGYRCDWGPTDETQNGIVWTAEKVKRVALAMDVAAGSYYDGANGELEQKCPALLADIHEFAAIYLSTWNSSAWNYNATVNSDTQGFFGGALHNIHNHPSVHPPCVDTLPLCIFARTRVGHGGLLRLSDELIFSCRPICRNPPRH